MRSNCRRPFWLPASATRLPEEARTFCSKGLLCRPYLLWCLPAKAVTVGETAIAIKPMTARKFNFIAPSQFALFVCQQGIALAGTLLGKVFRLMLSVSTRRWKLPWDVCDIAALCRSREFLFTLAQGSKDDQP